MSDCLGGYDFFDERHENILDSPRFVDCGQVTSDTFANTQSKILEINSKTGLYPLYVTYSIYRARLGNRDEKDLSLDELRRIWDETVRENIFVICKTPMAKAITKRTLTGFREVAVNAHYFDDLINYLKNKPEKFIERILKKSYWKQGGGKMKFEAVVGNPPYQVMDNGAQASAKPIYNYFIDAGKKIGAQYMSFIIPSRWYAGGKGLDLFRDDMLEDKHLEKLFDCLTPENIFPNTNIRSGVCWFLRNTEFDNKKDLLRVVTIANNKIIEDVHRPLRVEDTDIFIRHYQAISILNKVKNLANEFMESWISPRKPFGIDSAFSQTKDFKNTKDDLHDIECLAKGLKIGYINRLKITARQEWIDKLKVFMPRANNIGTELNDDNLNTLLGDKGMVCTEAYICIGTEHLNNKEQAKNLSKYLKTKFARFMHSIAKASQDATAKTFCFVPVQDFSKSWTDEQLYKKYNLTDEEINFIEINIKAMD